MFAYGRGAEMKLFFASDIHGSYDYAKKVVDSFHLERADLMVLLGDLLYHGPRNPLPEGYAPAKVAELLNQYAHEIIAVRGNCDSEVDQMVLNFPMMADYHMMPMNGYKIFMTHGHLYHKGNMPALNQGDVFIHGHFHIPMAEERNGIFILNPGSTTLPKENSTYQYAILEDDFFQIKSFEGQVIQSIQIKK